MLLLTACLPDVEQTGALPSAATAPATAASPITTAPSAGGALRTAIHGDGDSWRDTQGREYRLGMVNAPEVDECFGAQATAERKRLTASGFRAQEYARDRYGRGVSVAHAADGTNVNVHLARHGFADDRYLAGFRHENPALAAQLEAAFAAAKRERLGLWRACAGGQALGIAGPADAGDGCHPDSATCIPVQATAPAAALRTTSTAVRSDMSWCCASRASTRTAWTPTATEPAATPAVGGSG